jgi:Ser/Thr protein kinase RdoA (MazF antagonist)
MGGHKYAAMSAATAAAVASSYGLGAPVRDPMYAARGELGRIWRLDTEHGSWAVKELLVPMAEAAAGEDVAFQLAALAAGIPLPRPWRTGDGRVVLPACEAASPWSLRVYEWADLVAGPVATGAEIGALAARLHRLAPPSPHPLEAWFSEPLGEAGWRALLGWARRENAHWAERLDRWLPDLIALDAVIVPPDPATLKTCHRDLNTENVRRGADGSLVVLDWENSGPAQPERDLAAVVWDLAADASPAGALAAYQAYQAVGGPARVTVTGDFSIAAAVQGHLLELYGRRALDPDESEENASRARDRLDHMLGQPLTPARIGQLLELLAR